MAQRNLDPRLVRRRRRAPRSGNGKASAPDDPPATDWRDRHDRARALLAERQLALLEGRSLDTGRVLAGWQQQFGNVGRGCSHSRPDVWRRSPRP